MIPDFASTDRFKYRRMAPVYVADMRHLEISDRETWTYFMEGNFCCQKNNIPYTSIGRDHCGEQQNKVLKGRGGVSGKSSNANSSNFLTIPILSQIFSEMFSIGGMNDGNNAIHRQLGVSYTKKQNAWVVSLLRSFEKQSLFLSAG